MSTEARRASVPPHPDVPPHPGVPPRPSAPPRPARPPAPVQEDAPDAAATATARARTARPTGPGRPAQEPPHRPAPDRAEREAAPRATPDQAGRQQSTHRAASAPGAPAPAAQDTGTAEDGGVTASADTAPPSPRTAPRFTTLRAQYTDAMTPPPPPASARFPDTPPPPSRPAQPPRGDDTAGPAPADERPPAVPRPAPPHDFRRAPRPARPAPRPADGPDSTDAAVSRPFTTGFFRPSAPAPRPAHPDTPGPAAAEPPRPTAGGTRPPTAGEPPRSPAAETAPCAPVDRPEADSPSSRPDGGGPTARTGPFRAFDPAPRPTRPDSSRTTPPAPTRPADPAAPRASDRQGPRPAPADRDDPRPAGPEGTRSAAGAGGGYTPDRAWTPLPRDWVPAPEASGTAPRGGFPRAAQPDDGPAWSPAAALRQPDFAVPPPAAPPAPPVPEAPRRPGAAPDAVGGPDPSLSWSAPMAPGGGSGARRPVVTFGRPEGYRDTPWILGRRGRTAAAAVSAVLGLGLIGGALTGSWLVGGSGDDADRGAYVTAGGLWHNVPVDQLFPPTVDGQGAGPGGADRAWTRIAVAPDGGCTDAFDPLLLKVLAPVGCERLLRATYTDATQSYVTTVGLLFTTADAPAMRSLDARVTKEGLAKRADLMPRPYAAKGTVAAAFGDRQRAAWTISVLTDAPVVVYAVSGWADGRTVDTPQPAPVATASGATTAPAQAGLGNEAQGLADRVERGLRKTVVTPSSEQPS
ncbi:hypothetical protein QFZ56_001650 [Streptomyces achromogenes]|uniref:Uncharacterized protein n=1 Tax=Streptomyces achromogenes TaxID=67255 RepID=A0ABU0PWC9_STRAH|nr:hypothetical protein [Streptomyces achromogenes]